MDIFSHWVSLYNTLMKLFFIGSAGYILYLMQVEYKATWDPKLDTIRLEYLLGPCALLSLIINFRFDLREVSVLMTYVRSSGPFPFI